MLLVATTPPFDGAEIVVAVDSEFTEVEELVVGKVAEPDSWLARGAAPGKAMLPILSIRSMAEAGPVFMRKSEAWAITRSPFARRRWRGPGVGGVTRLAAVPGQGSIGALRSGGHGVDGWRVGRLILAARISQEFETAGRGSFSGAEATLQYPVGAALSVRPGEPYSRRRDGSERRTGERCRRVVVGRSIVIAVVLGCWYHSAECSGSVKRRRRRLLLICAGSVWPPLPSWRDDVSARSLLSRFAVAVPLQRARYTFRQS